MIIDYIRLWPDAFSVASVFPNANKVGALHHVTLSIPHEFIILSDFDTNLEGLRELVTRIDVFRNDETQMGYFFRMLPFEGEGRIFQYQQLEYCLARVRYKFHEKERTVPVMPGAGCCFKRETLNSIYEHHSGLRNGEDREATVIGRKMGYSVSYLENVLALTRPPLTFKGLIKQRIRWNLGYLETFYFQGRFYLGEIRKLSALGTRTLMDLSSVLFILSLPFIILMIGLQGPMYLLAFAFLYVTCLTGYMLLLRMASREYSEFKRELIPIILFFPIMKLCIDYASWAGAIVRFATRDYSSLKGAYK
jgi:cellulose synthase/poly-beta-1,6-N-acetylglucosamine synthase-like glycosyltransferase